MTDFYQKMADTAYRLIKDKGTPRTISNTTISSGYDDVTGMPLDHIEYTTTQEGVCVVLNYKTDIVNAPDSLIEQGDKKILLSAKGLTLDSLNGKLEALGRTYTIVQAKELNPAGLAIIYEVQARGNL